MAGAASWVTSGVPLLLANVVVKGSAIVRGLRWSLLCALHAY
jgi:hypothetical protein